MDESFSDAERDVYVSRTQFLLREIEKEMMSRSSQTLSSADLINTFASLVSAVEAINQTELLKELAGGKNG